MRPYEVIEKYGNCLELISMDPFFHEITVGLFIKDSTLTVYSYSNKEGVDESIEISNSFNHEAALFVESKVEKWDSTQLPENINNMLAIINPGNESCNI